MYRTGCFVACILLLNTFGSIQLISAQDNQGVEQIVDATNQVKQGLLSKIGLGTVAVVPATIAPTSTIPVTPITVATPPTTASPVTTAAVTTATTPTTTAAPSTTAAASTKPATTSTVTTTSTAAPTTSITPPTTTIAPTTTALPGTTAAATTKPATTSPLTTPPPTTACPMGSILVNNVCVLTCTAGSTPTNPCANNAYPTNSNQIDYTNPTPGDVTCEPGTDGNNYVTYTHSTKVKCTTNADCISGNAAGGAVCSTNNSTYCHQGASPSICPASGRKLLQHMY